MIAGIVCEYNPFHNGHLYHIKKTREQADAVVCVMSGNFVQRGDCAFADKWLRAEMAVKQGVDAVIDLPVPWSCASAGTFARGSIGLLGAFGVDTVSFGSESDDMDMLRSCAFFGENAPEKAIITEAMSSGLSYPAALSFAAERLLPRDAAELLSFPNAALAREYIKAASDLGLKLDFMAVKREGCHHDSDETYGSFASASRIREMWNEDGTESFMPEDCSSALKESALRGTLPFELKRNERGILSALRELSREEYSLYVDDSRGLSNRIYDSVKTAASLEELYSRVKTKGYTHSRIRREVLSLYLKIPNGLREGIPPYMRVLAVSKKGLALLPKAKEKGTLPLVTRHSEIMSLSDKAREVYALQCSSTDKFALLSPNVLPCGMEQTKTMFLMHN